MKKSYIAHAGYFSKSMPITIAKKFVLKFSGYLNREIYATLLFAAQIIIFIASYDERKLYAIHQLNAFNHGTILLYVSTDAIGAIV